MSPGHRIRLTIGCTDTKLQDSDSAVVSTSTLLYTCPMSDLVHARLDPETSDLLAQLRRRFGWTDSEVVRRGIHALSDAQLPARRRRIIGLGEFESGVDDLGSNRDHLEGFGR